MTKLAPENEAPGIIKEHKFSPRDDNQYLCGRNVKKRFIDENNERQFGWVRCNLAEAAHTEATIPYRLPGSSKYRCPNCVTNNIESCPHGPS